MNKEIKPCPFCGGEAWIVKMPYEKYAVVCKNDDCGASLGIYSEIKKQAIEAWNNRTARLGMASCKDCMHFSVCTYDRNKYNFLMPENADKCSFFKDRTRFVELPSDNLPVKVYLSDDIERHYILRDYFFNSDNVLLMIIECIETQNCSTRKLSDFGKTVFLSREEAKKALEEHT